MANPNAPFGLRPVRYLNGAPWTGQARNYYCSSGYATALYIGDPVVIVGDSNDNEINGCPPGSLSEIELATAGDVPSPGTTITGVIVGFLPITNESTIYRAASTERVALVCDDPNVVYQVRDDGSGTLTADTVGLNAVLVSGTGNTGSGLSGWALDGNADAPAADASNQLFILGLAKQPNNELSDYAIWEVKLNQQTYSPDGGLGVA